MQSCVEAEEQGEKKKAFTPEGSAVSTGIQALFPFVLLINTETKLPLEKCCWVQLPPLERAILEVDHSWNLIQVCAAEKEGEKYISASLKYCFEVCESATLFACFKSFQNASSPPLWWVFSPKACCLGRATSRRYRRTGSREGTLTPSPQWNPLFLRRNQTVHKKLHPKFTQFKKATDLLLSPTSNKVPQHVKALRLQFRNLSRLSGLVILGEAPESFAFSPSPAVDHLARHPDFQAITQHVQNPLGEVGLGLIQHGSRTWQRDYRQACLMIQNCPTEISPNVKTTIFIFRSLRILLIIKTRSMIILLCIYWKWLYTTNWEAVQWVYFGALIFKIWTVQ